jgi:prolyl-tRNA editing enzyme YbaK/EbsC (Cys-tRNA(Pro) deacylase)
VSSPSLSNHPGVQRVLGALAEQGIEPEVRYLPDAVRTAEAAAAALGISAAEIANSLVFAGVDAEGATEPVLVLASGAHRVDTDQIAALLGLAAVQRATPEQVRAWTGFAIGGVAPLGHLTAPRTLVDVDLAAYPEVWAAAGHSHTVFATNYAELLRITGGQAAEVR